MGEYADPVATPKQQLQLHQLELAGVARRCQQSWRRILECSPSRMQKRWDIQRALRRGAAAGLMMLLLLLSAVWQRSHVCRDACSGTPSSATETITCTTLCVK